jgi:hypothetical protein
MPKEMAVARKRDATAAFGLPNSDEEANGAKWNLSSARLEDAVGFETTGPKSEVGRFDPSSLYFPFKYRWRRPWGGNGAEALGDSRLGIHVSGQKVFFQPNFVFLTPLDSTEFREQLTVIEGAAPFKFNDNYFKRWAITPKRGNEGRLLKVPKGWRENWKVN